MRCFEAWRANHRAECPTIQRLKDEGGHRVIGSQRCVGSPYKVVYEADPIGKRERRTTFVFRAFPSVRFSP